MTFLGSPRDFEQAASFQPFFRVMEARRFAQGSTVYREGDDDGGLYLVKQGIAEVQVPSVTGEVVLMHLYWPDSWVGEGPILSGRPHLRSLVARTELVLGFIPPMGVLRLLRDEPETWQEIGKIALAHRQLAMRAYLDSAIKNPYQRCLATLLRLSGFAQGSPATDVERRIPISQQELGGLVNLCRNTTAKVIGSLAQERLVLPGYRQITIPSIERAIRRLGDFDK